MNSFVNKRLKRALFLTVECRLVSFYVTSLLAQIQKGDVTHDVTEVAADHFFHVVIYIEVKWVIEM